MVVVDGSDGTPSGFVPSPANPYGVWGDSGSPGAFGGGGNGVIGSSKFWSGVAGFTLSERLNASGVFGGGLVGVAGGVTGSTTFPGGKVGVYGTGANGRNLGGTGVYGESDSGLGVFGSSESSAGVAGLTTKGAGVRGVSSQNIGVFGVSNGTGVLGWGGVYAGYFFGDVHVTGNLSKGGGGFTIDHPTDPANRLLRHSFVESPERKNFYDGVATCNHKGEAVVRLPDWFQVLNADFRYQLTPVGKPGPGLYVATELKKGRFTIRGGAKGLKVCWQVTGTRKDAWARANPMVVEEKKAGKERGKYLHPEAHGVSRDRGIHAALNKESQGLLSNKKPAKNARKRRGTRS